MHVISARNVNDAYASALDTIIQEGERLDSRNGPVLRVPMPVTTRYTRPWERVLFDPMRDANPFFHLFEALWMLNGQNDVETLDPFLPSFKNFSDDGSTFHGAYGHRWRHWRVPRWSESDAMLVEYAEIDQLRTVINILQRNPRDRRAIIAMWDPSRDLGVDRKDIPCNDLIKLSINHDGALDMIVFNRSNDIIYGCYGANAVHMSILQEYLATMIGVAIGNYWQVSSDWHAYLETPYDLHRYIPGREVHYYADGVARSYPLVGDVATFDDDLQMVMDAVRDRDFLHCDLSESRNPFFRDVVQPMYRMHMAIRQKNYHGALMYYAQHTRIEDLDVDWFIAARAWIQRRVERQDSQSARDEFPDGMDAGLDHQNPSWVDLRIVPQ